MKLNNLRIIFSALTLTVMWQSEAFAGGGTTSTVTDNYKAPETPTSSPASRVAQPNLNNNAAKEVVEALNEINLGNTCSAPSDIRNPLEADALAAVNQHRSALNQEVDKLTASQEIKTSSFAPIVEELYTSNSERAGVMQFLEGLDSEAQRGALRVLETFRSNLTELSQDKNNNGKIDLLDTLEKLKKENPSFTDSQLKAELINGLILTEDQALALGISKEEYEQAKENNCFGKLIP